MDMKDLKPLTTEQYDTPPPPAHPTLADLERLEAGTSAAGVTPKPKKTRKHARKDPRFRCQFRFHLDANKPDELALGHELTALKTRRKYLPTLRNALRLYLDLKAGHTDVLFELFPWIADRLQSGQTPSPDTPSGGNLERLIQGAVQASVEAAMMEMPSLPATTPVAAPLKPNTNTIGQGVQLTAPIEDDPNDAPTIKLTKIAKTADGQPTETGVNNTLAAMFKMEADDKADRLYEERLAAGLIDPRTGRLREGASRSIQLD